MGLKLESNYLLQWAIFVSVFPLWSS